MNQTTATKTLAPRQLFTSLKIGPIALKHRIVMAPLTRSRSEESGNVPGRLMLDYYTQRTSAGGLIITEATNISTSSRGWSGDGAPAALSTNRNEGDCYAECNGRNTIPGSTSQGGIGVSR